MKVFYFNSKYITIVMIVLTMLALTASDSDAQTKRRKSTRKTLKPAKVRTVMPPLIPLAGRGEATIVSRSEDYQNDVQTLPVEPETVQPQSTVLPPTPENGDGRYDALSARIKSLETKPANEYDQKQKRLLLNLDILTRAEARSESLRKQLFDMIEKESGIKLKLEQIENDSRPENVNRAVAFAGTLRPEELRDMRAKNLEAEKRNLETLLVEIQETKANLQTNVQKADLLVEKLRTKLEQDIDDSLTEEPKN